MASIIEKGPEVREEVSLSQKDGESPGSQKSEDSFTGKQQSQFLLEGKASKGGENGVRHKEKPSKKFIDEDSRSPQYRSDEWRMKHFKVIPCSKRYAHDWTICPFAHPGEKARRRDPAVYNYAGIACPEMKKVGMCSRGDQCNYAHNVFEYWMHPARYRTQLCNDGMSCSRHVCFFAHTPEEIRVTALTKATAAAEKKEGLFEETSPDGPFTLNAHSITSTHSSVSGRRSMSLSPEDALRGGPEELSNGLDFSMPRQRSTKGRDVSNMFTRAMREGSCQDKLNGPNLENLDENSPEYQAQVMRAFKALDFTEAQLLLKLARAQVSQHAENLSRRESDTMYLMNRLRDNPDAQLCMRSLNCEPPQNLSPLQTAPAALHFSDQMVQSNSSGYLQQQHQQRMLSGDMSAMSGMYQTPTVRNTWQNGLMRRFSSHQPDASRAPSSNVVARMSMGDSAHLNGLPFSGPGTGGLYQTSSSTSNKSALHSQTFRLDDVSAQATYTPPRANRQLTAPVPSAFQQLATQEWKTSPGLGIQPQQDLQWRYSGDMAATQAQLNLRQQDYNRSLPPAWETRNRSGGLSAFSNPAEPNFDLLQSSFSGANQGQRMPHNLEALSAQPFDLSNLPPLSQKDLASTGLHPSGGPWINQAAM